MSWPALRSKVQGAGNLERFDYWLNTMRYLKAVGQVNCTWARFNAAMEQVKKQENKDKQKQLAREIVLPIRKELVGQVAEVHELLLATITTTGGMGTIANWQQHLLPSLLTQPGKELADILGEPLPADAEPSDSYDGPARLIVPTVRTSLTAGEDLRLKVILVGVRPRVTGERRRSFYIGGRSARASSRGFPWSMLPEASTQRGFPPIRSPAATSSTTCRLPSAGTRSVSP